MNKNRKTSHILNVFQFDANGHVILPATLTIGENPHSSDNTSKIPSTAWIRTYVTGLSYLTGNQSITVSGDATGSGTTAITLTLANTAVTPGTYGSTTLVPVVTVDSKGRITSVTTAAISGSLTFTGDVTGSGTTGTSTGLTLAASGVTAGTYTKVTVDSKGRVTVGANASTTDISEGTNLYYTDTRVGTYLTANSYATQSYVGTQIANLVASAPATLDTLNELSVALGNDPNFATSVATSIGTKQAQLNGTGFVKVIGTTVSYDNNTYLTSFTETDPIYVASTWYSTTNNATNWNTAYGWGNHAIVGYLTSVPTHNQAWSTITSTPTTISGYGITNAYTDAQIQNFFNGANAITGYNKSNWDTAYGWGNHASGGYLTGITSSQVTTALGYTPYNSTNPSGYITGITSSNVTTALGYTPYNSTNPNGYITGITSGNVTTALGFTPYNATNPNGYITSSGSISGNAATATSAGSLTGGTSSAYMLLYSALSGDLNTYNSPGLYSAEYTGSTNRPISQNGSFIQISDAGGTDVKTQWYYSSDGANIYMRLMWGDATWRAWRTLITDANIGSQSVSYATTAGSAPANGGTADYAHQLKWYGAGASVTNANTFQKGILSNYYGGGAISNIPDATYGSLYNFGGYDASSLSLQLFSAVNHNSTSSTRTLFFRMGNNLGFQNDWKTLLDNTNYSSYAVPLSGGVNLSNGLSFTGYNTPNAITVGSGDVNWSFGCYADGSAQYWMQVKYYGVGDDNRGFRIFNVNGSTVDFRVNGSGNGIFRGDVTAYSDARVKENIITVDNALSKVLALRGVYYNRIDTDNSIRKIGVIAQETLPIIPEVVTKGNDEIYTVAYGNMAGLFIEAIKEQQTQIEELKNKLDGLTR